jgi:hypothetical protein
MRIDQLSGVVACLKVAETCSFTRAAAELGVTPPSLSEAVRGLEARRGVPSTPADLADHDCVAYRFASTRR